MGLTLNHRHIPTKLTSLPINTSTTSTVPIAGQFKTTNITSILPSADTWTITTAYGGQPCWLSNTLSTPLYCWYNGTGYTISTTKGTNGNTYWTTPSVFNGVYTAQGSQPSNNVPDVTGLVVRVWGTTLFPTAGVTLQFKSNESGTNLWGPGNIIYQLQVLPPSGVNRRDGAYPFLETNPGEGLNMVLGSSVVTGGRIEYEYINPLADNVQ
jgi:hypothetical protein